MPPVPKPNVAPDESPYEALPFRPRPEVMSTLLRGIAASDGHFCRFDDLDCDEETPCYVEKPLPDLCPACASRLVLASASLSRPSSKIWEVWRSAAEPELVGVALLSEIQPGIDANAHYIFFDHDLRGKTGIITSLIDWAFEDHDDWKALQHVTIEVPYPAFALAKHASRKLGFGGPFRYHLFRNYDEEDPRGYINVEGVKPGGTRWNGAPADLLILGLQNGL